MKKESEVLLQENDLLLYDGECPFCRNYIRLLRIRRLSPDFLVIDARRQPRVWEKLLRKGYDIDQGMILKWRGEIYYGSDAIYALSLIADSDGACRRLNHWIFGSRTRARLLYPVLRWGRNASLHLLNRRGIRSSAE